MQRRRWIFIIQLYAPLQSIDKLKLSSLTKWKPINVCTCVLKNWGQYSNPLQTKLQYTCRWVHFSIGEPPPISSYFFWTSNVLLLAIKGPKVLESTQYFYLIIAIYSQWKFWINNSINSFVFQHSINTFLYEHSSKNQYSLEAGQLQSM